MVLRGGFCVDYYGDHDDIRKVIFCGRQVSVVRAKIRGTQNVRDGRVELLWCFSIGPRLVSDLL